MASFLSESLRSQSLLPNTRSSPVSLLFFSSSSRLLDKPLAPRFFVLRPQLLPSVLVPMPSSARSVLPRNSKACLRIPGIPFVPSDRAARFTTHRAFLSFPHQRVVFRPTQPVRCRSFSFCPFWTRQTGVHSFNTMKKGSLLPLPVRCFSPTWPCPPALHIPRVRPRASARVTRSAPAPTKGTSLAPLEERRAARQARDRPWLQGSVLQPRQRPLAAARSRGPSTVTRSSSPPPRPCNPSLGGTSTSVSRSSTSVSRSTALSYRASPPPRPRNPSPFTRRGASSSTASRLYSLPPRARNPSPPSSSPSPSPSPSPDTSGPIVPAAGTRATSTSSGLAERRVRFGETTVVPVQRWIVRQEHVHLTMPSGFGHLQGWDVTALPEPDEAGEEYKYTTYWGSDSYVMLTSNHAKGPCKRTGCAWNALGQIRKWRPRWGPSLCFVAWNFLRERRRQRGEFVL